MATGNRDSRHFVKPARSASDAFCIGRYMEVCLERVLINVPISAHNYGAGCRESFTLVRVLYTNNWGHRICTDANKAKLVDTDGIQHGHASDCVLDQEVNVHIAEAVTFAFNSPDYAVEGNAKARGWLLFPALPKRVYPHRFIFHFAIFEPGDTCGMVQDSETIEVRIDFSFRNPVDDEQRFLTLEID